MICLLWQIMSFFVPPYLIPGIPKILGSFYSILNSAALLGNVLKTFIRIIMGLSISFVFGAMLAIFMALFKDLEKYVLPVIHFIMGIPALSWVIFAIIWFSAVEVRIAFIIVAVCLPSYMLIIYDEIKGVSKELKDMLMVFRPTRMQVFKKLILPAVVPSLLTSWKVNLGLGTRVAIVAELVGATIGIGNKLLIAQERFDMPLAIAWTLYLVVFLLGAQLIILRLEKYLLRWRPTVI